MHLGREARQSLPLHPATLSRESVLFPRTENFSRPTIFFATERFRTGMQGLLNTVRGELARTELFIPQEIHLPKDPQETIIVGIASNNNIKIERMKELVSAHNLDIHRVPEAEEWHTKNVILDATSKAVDAARIIRESEDDVRREVRNRAHVTMATDQLNAIPVVVDDPFTHEQRIHFKRLGKPSNPENLDALESIRQTFKDLSTLSHIYNWQTVPYLIELATVIHNPADPDNNAVSVQKSVVFLSPEGIDHLATDRFDEYVSEVGKTFDIKNIAGGLEVKVLEQMGIVHHITGTAEEAISLPFPAQREEAKEHAHELALGHADEKLVREYFGEKENKK